MSPPLTERLARVLASESEGALPTTDRDATVKAMAHALKARRRRRSRRIGYGGVAAAAAVAFGILGAARGHAPGSAARSATAPAPVPAVMTAEASGAVLVMSGGRTSAAVDGMPLGPGDRVLAMLDGRATLALATGTRLSMEGGGDVAILSEGAVQIFALGGGAVRADVARLGPGERFIIRTDDAEVEVHGTSFRVATVSPDPVCLGGTRTRVAVYAGVVTVRSGAIEAAVHPGESWPPGCVESPVALATSASDHAAPAPRSLPAVHAASPASELAAQNDLFDVAMQAKRRGGVRAAVAAFDRLLSRYPACPFAESASLERMKLLASYEPVRAEDAARDYLRRYPSGSGRTDALALLH
jgi:ferric-dicitrate binding protein FerR (iron transport regulator)